MKLTIFGASGRTGTHLAEQALAAGHDVVALMRDPAKLTLRHERLRVVQGELTDEAAVRDAVLATLSPKIFGGPRVRNGHHPGRDAHPRRPLARLQLGAEHPDPPQPVLRALRNASFALLGRLPATRSMVNETAAAGEAIRSSERDWTIVVVTAPQAEPGTGRVKVCTASGTGDRTDLAQFMLAQADDLRYVRQELRISN
jgi:uncharacterized protein YbjT (DUF2867 family)